MSEFIFIQMALQVMEKLVPVFIEGIFFRKLMQLVPQNFTLRYLPIKLNFQALQIRKLFSENQFSQTPNLKSQKLFLLHQMIVSFLMDVKLICLRQLIISGQIFAHQWIPSYCNIPDNEKADFIAKNGFNLQQSLQPLSFSSLFLW